MVDQINSFLFCLVIRQRVLSISVRMVASSIFVFKIHHTRGHCGCVTRWPFSKNRVFFVGLLGPCDVKHRYQDKIGQRLSRTSGSIVVSLLLSRFELAAAKADIAGGVGGRLESELALWNLVRRGHQNGSFLAIWVFSKPSFWLIIDSNNGCDANLRPPPLPKTRADVR